MKESDHAQLLINVNKGKSKSYKIGNETKKLPKIRYVELSDKYGARLNIKPLSVNSAYRGRRFKTPLYSAWKKQIMTMFPDMPIPTPPYEIRFKFGFSSKASDIDNPVKSLMDCLSEYYGFNDKLVRRIVIDSEIVGRGNEYCEFEILKY